MGAKKFQISIDSGSTYITFPGDTADLQNNAGQIKDTVFGQLYESNQPGIINWMMSANGIFKGYAGYVAVLKKGGTPTTMTAEPCALVSGKIYKITNAVKRVISRADSLVVLDNAVDHTTDVLSIDYLNGTVTFKSAYTPTTPITVTGKYLPMSQIAKGQSFTLTQTATVIDTSDFISAQANNGYKNCDYGLKTVSLDIKGFYAVSNAWIAQLQSRGELVIEIGPDGSSDTLCRGFFRQTSQQQSGKVGELEVEQLKFDLNVPDPGVLPLMAFPFSWYFTSSPLSPSLINAINSWTNSVKPNFNYLYDGTNGQTGIGVLNDVSLSGGLEVMNTFAIKVTGDGGLTAVGTG